MLALFSLFIFLPSFVAEDFCNVQGRFVDEFTNAIDPNNKEASGLTLNPGRTHFFTISDSPKSNPLVFVTTNAQRPSSASTVKIIGIRNTGFNGGYGDWEAVVSFPCSTNPSLQCILIGDIGHNKVRGKGGSLRSSSQSVRFIEVEEPTALELDGGKVVEKQGKEFSFKYPDGHLFDAEAMVVKDKRLFVVTKNSQTRPYAYMFEVPALRDGVELVPRAILQVRFSEVTGAASTPGYLILRTYVGLNFYKWDSLCDDSVRKSKFYQIIEYLERDHGMQEAVEFDASTGYVYLVGEGDPSIFRMRCAPASSPTLSPTFGAKCMDDFNGAANMASASSPWRHTSPAIVLLLLAMPVCCF